MSDSADELFSKADALLSRWRGASQSGKPPADYPVLTDIVDAALRQHADRPQISDLSAGTQSSSVPIGTIEARLRQRVLRAIEPAIADMIADRIRARFEESAKRLAGELSGQVSEDITALVREIVHRALEREVAILREEYRGSER